VAGVGGSGLLEVLVGEGGVTDLLPEGFAGGGEVGAEAVIEELNYLGEADGSVFVAAGADFGGGGERAADGGFQEDAALADFLDAVVLEGARCAGKQPARSLPSCPTKRACWPIGSRGNGSTRSKAARIGRRNPPRRGGEAWS
jgi:hypothetical protein